MRRPSQIVVHGAIAGFLGATALAAWFFVLDALQGQPFYTPNFLASALAGREGEVPAGAAVLTAVYTVLHYVVFVLVGIVSAWLMRRLRTAPGLLLGVVLGFLLFDLIFYASVAVTGVDVVQALGWPQVLFGNIVAGVTVAGYLHFKGAIQAVSWGEALRGHRILREGLYAGLIGAGAVAVWFLILDAARGRLFFTPAALGSALFDGARSVADVQVTPTTVLGYSLLHVTAFLVTGWIVAALATEAEQEPPLALASALLFVTFETLFIGLLAIVAGWLLDSLDWWTIAVGNLVAAAAMGVYLWREHPGLRKQLRDHGRDLEEPAYHG